MSGAAAHVEVADRSWRGLLFATVRLEFRGDTYLPPYGSPLLSSGCAVEDCRNYSHYRPWGHATSRALCAGHGDLWVRDGKPPVDEWLATRVRPLRALRPPKACCVEGCPRSASGNDFCRTHDHDRQAPVKVGDGRCDIDGCDFVRAPRQRVCDGHRARWLARRRFKTFEEFATYDRARREHALGVYVFRGLPDVVKLELQFVVQQFADEQQALEARRVAIVADVVRAAGVVSMLDRDADEWRALGRAQEASRWAEPEKLLPRLHGKLTELARRDEDPWAADTWVLARLPIAAAEHGKKKSMNFARINRPWLRAVLKRWARHRLRSESAGIELVNQALWAWRHFETFLDARDHPLDSLEDLTRELLEEFQEHVCELAIQACSRRGILRAVKVLIDDVDRFGWAEIPRGARYFHGELPRQPASKPRFIDEGVMVQLESDEVLAELADDATITAVMVLEGTGMRSQDVLLLDRDPVIILPDSAAVLRFRNHKSKRDAAIPISGRLLERIRAQQQRNQTAYPNGTEWLLPSIAAEANGRTPYSYGTLLARVHRWLGGLSLRDTTGQIVKVTPHQFRHTLGTRMINKEVPLEVIMRMLDHSSPTMTAVYARISDQTLRTHFDAYRARVNRHGEVVRLEGDGLVVDAAWTKDRLARARQALPNGHCGLAIQQSCPHPNACLSCDDFLSDLSFKPLHIDHLGRVEVQIAVAKENGWDRVVESNESDRLSLIKILERLERLESEGDAEDAA